MAHINLSQSNAERSKQELNSIFDKSLVISILLIIVSFGTLFGLNTYNASLDQKMVTLNDKTQAQLGELEGDSINHVIDFQERMTKIDEKLSSSDISPQDMFALMEKLVVSGTSLDSYKYDIEGKTVVLKTVSNDFKTVALQVMNLKSQNTFKNVTVTDTIRKDDGKVTSEIIISL